MDKNINDELNQTVLRLRIFLYLLIFHILYVGIYANSTSSFVEDEVIIRLGKNISIESFISNQNDFEVITYKALVKRLNIWLLKVKYNKKTLNPIAKLISNKSIISWQKNHSVSHRSETITKTNTNSYLTANDAYFTSQWSLNNTGQFGGVVDADIDVPEAYDFVQQSNIPKRSNIVVAVIDDGFDLNHEDLQFWNNINEIADNGLDDDNNGYIDDYKGWNAYNSSSILPVAQHGTHVCGIISAINNNNIGITGIAGNVKVMPISGASETEATVLEALGYIYEMRSLYNETNGAKGALIVAVNGSFGVDRGNPEDYPIWSSMYDELGRLGILSVAATANSNLDIDVIGDMPTSCTSDYLITVTNTTNLDQKNYSAGYGINSIDLGAPGTNIISSFPNNQYGFKTGTSMATPTATGVIAYIYSILDDKYYGRYLINPATVALELKEELLLSVDNLESLDGVVKTGGRVNLNNFVQKIYSSIEESQINVTSGWNLISVPLKANCMLKDSLFKISNSNAFRYTNGYLVEDTLKNGIGYWLKFDEKDTFSVHGLASSQKTITVKSGWNMVAPFETDIDANEISTIPENIITSRYYEFTNGYKAIDTLEVGKGYWIKVNSSGTLNFDSGLKKNGVSNNSEVVSLNDYQSKITLIDANNCRQELFLTKNYEDVGLFEMPPIPPNGIFDVRFIDNTQVNNIEDESKQIQINGAEFPIKLLVAGNTIEVSDLLGGDIINTQLNDKEEIVIDNSNITQLYVKNINVIEDYSLEQNYPNPFNPSTIIKFSIPEKSQVELNVFNVLGERIAQLINCELDAGHHKVEFDVSSVNRRIASGIFIYQLKTNNYTNTIKMILIK